MNTRENSKVQDSILESSKVEKYYIFGYSDYIKNSLADILSLKNVLYFDLYRPSNIFKRIIHRVFISRYTHLLSRILIPLWKNVYWLGETIDKDKVCVVVLYEINPISNKQEWIDCMRKLYPKMRFVYIFTNIIDRNNEWRLRRIVRNRNLYDLVLTFNRADAEKYGLDYYEGVFSRKSVSSALIQKAVQTDVYFCGLDKGRLKTLGEIYCYLKKRGINCVFDIIYPKDDLELDDGVDPCGFRLHSEMLQNDVMLANVIKCECILEVLVDVTQPGSSLRMCEAVVYGKKLLTNNPFIFEKYFYDEAQMFYFKKPQDIDIQFIQQPNKHKDYLPEDLLSPKRLLDFIEKRVTKYVKTDCSIT